MVGAPNRQRQNDGAKSAAVKSSILTEENHQRRVTYSGREREEGAYRGKPPHQVRGGGLTGQDHHLQFRRRQPPKVGVRGEGVLQGRITTLSQGETYSGGPLSRVGRGLQGRATASGRGRGAYRRGLPSQVRGGACLQWRTTTSGQGGGGCLQLRTTTSC